MELRQLVYLDAVVRHGGFTRAAEQLRIAQPAISAQIKNLERELGVQLLHRTTRVVRPTQAGEDFLREVRLALAHLEQARMIVQEHQEVQLGHLRVGATPLTGGVDVVRALREFRVRHPAVTMLVDTGLADPLLARLRGGELDAVIAPAHETEPPGLDVVLLAEESLVLVTPPADMRRIASLNDVAADRFVCLPRGSGLRRLLDEAMGAVGAQADVAFETQTPAGMLEMVAAGLGSALVAASAAERSSDSVRVHRLAGLPPHPPICVFHRRSDNSAAVRAFVATLTGTTSQARERPRQAASSHSGSTSSQ